MKILLVNPSYVDYSQEGRRRIPSSPPLGVGYIASYLIKNGFKEVDILDAEAKKMSYDMIKEQTQKYNPDIIGFPIFGHSINHCLEISKRIKEILPSVKIVAGGYQPTSEPRKLLKHNLIDFVIIGESEITFYELVKMLDLKKNNFEKINGLGFKKNKKIVINPPRKMIKNLDELPFPARHLMPNHLYSKPAVITSRGCPYNCNFCYSPVLWGSVRFRSPKNVVDEIEELHDKYGAKYIGFADDIFTLNEKRTIEICKRIREKKLKIKWDCWSRVDTLSEKVVKEMKKAGCRRISFGFESGDQKILNSINKKATLEQAKKAVDLAVKYKIRTRGSFMIGNIGETKESIRKTIDFAKSLKLNRVSFWRFCPMPGTEIYRRAKKLGILECSNEYSEYTSEKKGVIMIKLPGISTKELIRLKNRAYREYYIRPSYLFYLISNTSFKELKNMFLELLYYLKIIKLEKTYN